MLGKPRSVWRNLIAMAVICISLGYIEAALVVYLREILVPLRLEHFPGMTRELLPMVSLEQLRAAGGSYPFLLAVEVCREPAPLILLAACAWAFGRAFRSSLAYFLIGFGIWDICYYASLKILVNWPASLATWDVLYLIPTAWVAPVWAPLAASVTMIAAGLLLLLRGPSATWRRALTGALLALVGAGLILTSFLLRSAEAFERVPVRYDWQWFLGGWLLSVLGLCWGLRVRREPDGVVATGPAQ